MTDITEIIDPPVTAYSPPDEIRAWIKELKQREMTDEVEQALADAKRWLEAHPNA